MCVSLQVNHLCTLLSVKLIFYNVWLPDLVKIRRCAALSDCEANQTVEEHKDAPLTPLRRFTVV